MVLARPRQHYELPDRREPYLRRLRSGRQVGPAFLFRCCVPSLHHLHVQQPEDLLGLIYPRLPGSHLRNLPLSIVQIWCGDSEALQVRRRVRCVHAQDPGEGPRRSPEEEEKEEVVVEFNHTEAPALHRSVWSNSLFTVDELPSPELIRSSAHSIMSLASTLHRAPPYEGNLRDVDHVNTRGSFK